MSRNIAPGLRPPSRQAAISASGSGQPAGSGVSPPAARLLGSRQPMAGAGWGAGLGAGADSRRPLARHRGLHGGIVSVPPAQGPGGSRSKGESNDQVTHPAEGTEPSADA